MKNKILKILILVTTIGLAGNMTSCSKVDKNKEKPIENQEITKVENSNLEDKENLKVENENQDKVVEEIERKIDFSKYSDNRLIRFSNAAMDKLEEIERQRPNRRYKNKDKFSLLMLKAEELEIRKNGLEKIYNNIELYDSYTEIDGRVYLKEYYKEHKFGRLLFNKVESKEVIDNETLRVKFRGNFRYGNQSEKIKTVDFTEVNGELRAKTSFVDQSIYATLENPDEKRNVKEVNEEYDKIWDYVYEKLNDGILTEGERVAELSARYYDKTTNDKYYAINIKGEESTGALYYININNGNIYDIRANDFVVKN